MAAKSREARRFHAGRTAADDEDALLSGCLLSLGLAKRHFACSDRIDGTSNCAIEEGLRHAGVAINAGADVFGASLGELVGEVRIREEFSAHGDDIGLPVADQAIRGFRFDSADGDHGHADSGLNQSCGLDICVFEMCQWSVGEGDAGGRVRVRP